MRVHAIMRSKASRLAPWLVGLVVLLGFGLRATRLGYQSLWRDEVDAIRFASRPWAALVDGFGVPGHNGPFYYTVLRPWLDLVGRSEYGLRFFSLLLGVLAIPLVYRLARRSLGIGGLASVVAALLCASSPVLVWYSQEGKMYSLALMLVVVAVDCYLLALMESRWWRWAAFVVSMCLAFYTHVLTALLLPALALLGGIRYCRRGRAGIVGWIASLAALAALYVPLAAWQVPMLVNPAETGFRFVPLPTMVASLLSTFVAGVARDARPWELAPVLALAGLAVFPASGLQIRWRLALALWLCVPVLALFGICLRRPLFTVRYLLYVQPALALLAGAGTGALMRRKPLLAALLAVPLLVVCARGVWSQATTQIKADMRSATRFVAQRLRQTDLLLFQIPYARHTFEYYLGSPVALSSARVAEAHLAYLPRVDQRRGGAFRWADGPYTNSGMSEPELDRAMIALTSATKTVWYLETEAELWDSRGLVLKWLSSNAHLTEDVAFTRVRVRRFELPR